MRGIYKITLLLGLFTFASCSPEVDDLFDQTAAKRIDETIAQDLAVLRGAANGWVMEYYPSKDLAYGGYTMLVSFGEDGKADISCDLFTADKVSSGEYEVKQSAGPMLTFDTYNEVFHFFSEPANPLGIGRTGEGMAGDYEFLILEATPEKVVLKGKKTGIKAVMTPLSSSQTWVEYLTAVRLTARKAYPAAYDVKIGGEVAYTVRQYLHLFTLVNLDGSEVGMPFVYTPDGIKFYEPITIGGVEVQSMTWNDSEMAYTSNNVTIAAQPLPAGYKPYEAFLGDYTFYYNRTAQVSITEDLFNASFIMRGFPYDLRLTYNADSGTIGLTSQLLSGSIYLCPWALNAGGSLTNLTGAGLIGTLNDNGIIMFRDNGVWGKVTDSFIAYDFSAGASIFQIPYIQGMIKN